MSGTKQKQDVIDQLVFDTTLTSDELEDIFNKLRVELESCDKLSRNEIKFLFIETFEKHKDMLTALLFAIKNDYNKIRHLDYIVHCSNVGPIIGYKGPNGDVARFIIELLSFQFGKIKF